MDAADSALFAANHDSHLAVAEIAVHFGYCSIREAGRVLFDLPELQKNNLGWNPKRIWVDAGPLDHSEWISVLAELRRRAETTAERTGELPRDTDNITNDRRTPNRLATTRPETQDIPVAVGDVQKDRYVMGGELGRGGGGLVIRAFDDRLQRVVAMKLPATQGGASRQQQQLLIEAQTTSRLEHPNIVPVYDTGVLPSGARYYTMRRVSGRSLRDVLRGLKAKDPKVESRWPLNELLRAFIEVTHAMEYAHYRSLIHRDLKPENIMLGDFGEVYVMDWGLAASHAEVIREAEADPTHLATVGTPAYMSPEQASGNAQLTPQTDIYSLGVILYELLTHVVPSRRDSVVETLLAVASEPILPPSKVVKYPIDVELDEIVMRALQRLPKDRYASVREFRHSLQVYVSGKRPLTAAKRLEEALAFIETYDQGVERIRKLRAKAQHLAANLRPSDSIQEKRAYWRAEERVERVEEENALILEKALNQLHASLHLDPDLDEARSALADLAWRRYTEAVEGGDGLTPEFSRAVLRQYDVTGRYAHLLDDPTTLRLTTDTAGVEAFIQSVELRDRRLHLGQLRYLGSLPLQVSALPRGSWHITLKQAGLPAIQLPVLAQADQALEIFVPTESSKILPPGFAFVPRGESIVGGDNRALDPLPRSTVTVSAFAAQTRHVLVQEYLEWIRSLAHYDASAAELRIPILSSGLPLIRKGGDDQYRICPAAMHQLNPDAEVTDDLPVVGIRTRDIEDYIRWRSTIDGVQYRLPTELEYERMARGADGRHFPWGNRFDPALCTMWLSSPESPRLQSVGHALSDKGPFGHRDLAGNIRELCRMEHSQDHVVRGGSWQSDERSCRAASRLTQHAGQRRDDVGFRLVIEV